MRVTLGQPTASAEGLQEGVLKKRDGKEGVYCGAGKKKRKKKASNSKTEEAAMVFCEQQVVNWCDLDIL